MSKMHALSSPSSRQHLSSLDRDDVAHLIGNIGLARYRQGFIDAGFTGTMLMTLVAREELAEVGIIMPSLIFKGFLRYLNEVHYSFNYYFFIFRSTIDSTDRIQNRLR